MAPVTKRLPFPHFPIDRFTSARSSLLTIPSETQTMSRTIPLSLFCLLALTAGGPLLAAPAPAPAAEKAPAALSSGKELALTQYLVPEKPTLFLFLKGNSTMERSFADTLRKEIGPRAGIQLIPLKTGEEPVAKQYEVKETPTAVIYDRRGRVVARSSDAEEIRKAVQKAAGVPRIDWAADDDPRMAQVEKVLGRRPPGGILRTMSLQPDWLAGINDVARKAHFSDGALTRRQHEMIASYVSALNKCKY